MSNTVKKGSIFNVEEVQGVEKVRHETTAAYAQAEALNSCVAHQVEENAEHAQQAAAKAALAAQGMVSDLTGDTRTALDDLQSAVAQKTNAAAGEGQKDIHAAKDASESYLYQAKTMAENVVTSAQDYLHGSTDPQAASSQEGSSTRSATATHAKTDDIVSSAVGTAQQYLASAQAAAQPHIDRARSTLHPQTASSQEGSSSRPATATHAKTDDIVSSAVGTAQQYLASAQAAAQPHIDRARSTLQPHVEKALETAEGYLGMHSGTSPSDAVTPPASGRSTTNAPLSDEDVKGKPYASTTATAGADQEKLESNVA